MPLDPLLKPRLDPTRYDVTLRPIADIAKCDGGLCPLRSTCLRYKRPPHTQMQNYIMGIPFNVEKGTCDYYVTTKKNETEGNSQA